MTMIPPNPLSVLPGHSSGPLFFYGYTGSPVIITTNRQNKGKATSGRGDSLPPCARTRVTGGGEETLRWGNPVHRERERERVLLGV